MPHREIHPATIDCTNAIGRWTILKLNRGLGEHIAAWDELRHRIFDPNPMLDSRFVDALLQHFGDGREHLWMYQENGATHAMCVMRRQKIGIWTTFLPSQTQIGPVLLQRPRTVHQVFKTLPGIAGQIDFLCNDPHFGDLSHIESRGGKALEHALTMNLSLTGGIENYRATRSKKLLQNMGRYERRLVADAVTCRFVCIDDPSEIGGAVARYGELESKGWKGKLGTALSASNAQGTFYRDIVERFSRSRQAHVYELWFGDQLAASRIVIREMGTLVMLKTTFDESFDKYAPGRLLLQKVIELAFEKHPGGLIEFYTDANQDLLAWGTGQRWISHVSFFRSAIAASLLDVVRTGRQVLLERSEPAADAADVVSVFRHPDELPIDVQKLFEKAEKEYIEFGLTWYRNLANTVYQGQQDVSIYVLRQNGIPIAALPVLCVKRAWWQRIESLSNYYTAIYAPLLAHGVKAVDLVLLIRAIRRAHPSLAALKFMPMDPQSTGYRLLQEALKMAGLPPFKFFCFGNWYIQAGQNWPDYLHGLDGILRNTIKRLGKKFATDGGTLELVQGGPNLERGLRAYETVYAASWKPSEPYPNFMPGLIRACAARGWLRLGIAWVSGQPIAAQLWIVADGKADIYKLAHHENFKYYAPGTLLTAMLMQHVMEKDTVTEVDFLIGDDLYKQSWMNRRRERWGLVAYNPRTIPGLFGLAREIGGRATQLLKSR